MLNILIFPAGTEIGKEIYMSLVNIKGIKVTLAGSDYDNHARHYYENYHILPSVEINGWIKKFQKLIESECIDYIFPAHDDALLALSDNRDFFKAQILCPSKATCKITRFKSLTYQMLSEIVPVPHVYYDINKINKWPVFVKPDRGQGAQGAQKIANKAALEIVLSENKGIIVSEFLSGEEYTIDCFTDRDAGLLYCQPRRRTQIKAGIAVSSDLVKLEGIEQYADSISQKLNIYGAWFFQVKSAEDGVLKVMEVAPRIAGTMALSRANGVNLPELTVYEHLRKSFVIQPHSHTVRITRSLMNQYSYDLKFQHVYVDYDDTIIVNEKINIQVISFLYKCINRGIKIHLITKHQGDIYSSLDKYRLRQLFDTVIHLSFFEDKCEFIVNRDAIFIDDSFSERIRVANKIKIPVFDVSMIEVLNNAR